MLKKAGVVGLLLAQISGTSSCGRVIVPGMPSGVGPAAQSVVLAPTETPARG